jgi:membrane associated rhomboid family serine protease
MRASFSQLFFARGGPYTFRVMGIYDRDYTHVDYQPRRSPPMFGSARMQSVNTWLIIINVAVFLLDRLLLNNGIHFDLKLQGPDGELYAIPFAPLEYWGHFSASTALGHLQLWRFITFQFLHANGMHLLVNMLSLFFFGPIIESYLGPRRYLAFYLLSGMGGGLAYLVLWALHALITASWMPLVGASAGIFGVLVAGALVAPNTTVLIYGIIPMRLRTMAWLLLGIAGWTVIFGGHNAGGQAAHLGGAAVGFALIRNPRLLQFVDRIGGPRRSRMR